MGCKSKKRWKKYCVIYRIYDDEGKAQQKWETYDTEAAAKKRKLEVEYKLSVGTFEVPKCVTVKELLDEYVNLYGREKWGFSTYDGNISTINNYIIPTIGNKKLDQIDNHFIEKYYQELLEMPAVKSSRNMDESGKITLRFKMSVAFVVYKLCDKNRLSTVYIEEFLNKIQEYDFNSKPFCVLNEHGINEKKFFDSTITNIVIDEL